jgi:hypothetical protein
MAWTPITGASDYTNGLTVSHAAYDVENPQVDPFLNVSGTQDYTTYYTGSNGKSITPDPGNSGLSNPTAGYSE